jgi:predicted Fe-S protein YdhL (DUF1289 family)
MDGASKLCEGCLRTLDEIAAWGGMDDHEKHLLWDEIARRKKTLELRASNPPLIANISIATGKRAG